MAKVQHYLSQMYLRGFSPWRYDKTADERQKNHVWVYFLKKKEILLTSVRNVAGRSYYSFKDHTGSYNHSVEQLFSKIEDRVADTFRSVETGIDEINIHAYTKGISETDRRNLMKFILLHMIRVPDFMEYIRQEMAEHETRISKKYGKDYSEDYVQKNLLRVLTRVGRSKDTPLLDYLLKKDCRILSVLRSRACFLTTDNPVQRLNKTNPADIFYTNTEVYLPINQRALMLLHGNKDQHEIVRFKDLTVVFDFNCHMARRAKELIVCSNAVWRNFSMGCLGPEIVRRQSRSTSSKSLS
jgi:hypothetical protein